MRKTFSKFAYPYIIWIILTILAPIFLILTFSVLTDDNKTLTGANFLQFFTWTYLKVFFRSLQIASFTTMLCLFLGYPIALFITRAKQANKSLLLFLFMLPTWTNIVLRTYAWFVLFYRGGLIENVFKIFGLTVSLQYSTFAVYLGMVYNFLPFMILPLYTSISKIDASLVQASEDLGATRWQTLKEVILPLSFPGIITGIIMVFLPAATTFVIPQLLGGGKYNLIGNTIERTFKEADNMQFGSALSVILIVVILISLLILNKYSKDTEHERSNT